MITISSAMLVILGLLLAALMLVVFLPAYRRRIERFAADAVKRSLPLTEDEIRADRDRLRADHAMSVHKLETKLEDAELAAARQSVEINRRDARVHELEENVAAQKLTVDELQNARRVLEQAILDRLPKVEQRLTETRKLLADRDADITVLADTSAKQTSALEESTQINIQQSEELHRLRAALEARAARNRETLGDPRYDGEVALRTEIEMLRSKTRDQAGLIDRLQSAVNSSDERGQQLPNELYRVRSDLGKAESELLQLRASEGHATSSNTELEQRVRTLEADERDRAAEIARLKAALTSYQKSGMLDASAQQQPPALSAKAELSALQAEVDEQRRTIQSLRSDLASSNERLARQSQHFRDELRRLGSGALAPLDAGRRRSEPEARPSLAERITAPKRAVAAGDGDQAKPGNLNEPRVAAALKSVPAASANENETLRPPTLPVEGHADPETPPRRPKLLERINSLEKMR